MGCYAALQLAPHSLSLGVNMYENSVLRATGQMWKLYLATLFLVPGATVFVWGAVGMTFNLSGYVYQLVVGGGLSLLGITFAIFCDTMPLVRSALVLVVV